MNTATYRKELSETKNRRTNELVDKVKDLREKGLSIRDIANDLGIVPATVRFYDEKE